jgi:hypothetical protein
MRQAIEKALTAVVVVSGMALTQPAAAEQAPTDQPSQDEPGDAVGAVVTLSAVVQKVDKTHRVVTLRGQDGDDTEVKVAPDVNLGRLYAGDVVIATYYEEVAIGVRKSDRANPRVTKTTFERGGVMAEQTTLTAQVISVDPDRNKVVIRGAQGKPHAIKVRDPDVQAQLATIKKGDNVEVTYTQAVAVSVDPKKK